MLNHHLEQIAMLLFDKFFPNVTMGKNTVGEYIIPKRGKGLLSKDAVAGEFPIIAGGLQPAAYHNSANTKAPVITISASGANAGFVNLWTIPVWSSDSSFIDESITNNVYFWYIMLKKRQKEIYDAQTGSAQPHIYPKHITAMLTTELQTKEVEKFNEKIGPLFEDVGNRQKEITKLQMLRDTLLPRLMSSATIISSSSTK
ncbi:MULTISPECIES: restriction endonuclease subunit S [Tetragenococcus]|uniref:Type I restriction modification DNA specificity domain-containing protein n=1 Tax=Tetragenococcus halophilus (strain DSM 20338 / JCM 20259 / NCIMB 9735 / NBRC 12172) TaxID=945021 RepID=A0AAN1SHX8_TETHN|nr:MULTISPECIES: restriction endonuclease subunit S [Tetragenococcus]MCF1616318.1 restriction endonuclease subunit S [Tetragenococcus koreensis]MCF1621231.1 restriction endonuclease subunit S [Tetragenococcus koreensis]MCF1631225.1 restriction endonuclease subunit S [Tetragenococcus koreensis]MCF1677280.1 restriction endonuclease subunit S [Tetragenococcus koreensis]MCF1679620.1 restriction endonuclease subunit S [Tetragenococcus koreensis]